MGKKINTSIVLAAFLLFCMTPALTAGSSYVKLTGHYKAPANLNNENVTFLKGINDGEYLEIIIEGTIYDFEHLRLGFEGEGDDFRIIETGLLNKLGTLTDQIVIIETYLPEGIPSERIKWKGGDGTVYEYDFYENGMGANEWSFIVPNAPDLANQEEDNYWPLTELKYKEIKTPEIIIN
jgi:hypothetical protein